MPIYSIKAPDGRTYRIEGPEGASQEDIIAHVLDDHPEAATPLKPKTGIGAAIGQGVEQLISSGRTAYGALTGSPEEAAQAGLARGEDIGKRYEDQVSLQKVKDVYAARGILPAAGEAISQIPAAIAQQAPNLASMAGSARLGAMAGSPLGPIGSIVGGVAGAALPSLIQQFGGNVERQASEQQKAGRPISIDVGAAGAAAVPQAGLDVAGNLIPFGGRIITKLTGIPMQALLGRTAAQATKLADEKLLATLSKGIGVGALAEIPTEIAQQMLERAQAGLSLSDADAMKEYGETAYQVGLLAPLGAVGRLSERSGARAEVGQRQDEEKRKTQLEQMQTEADKLNAAEAAKVEAEANKQTPDYAVQFADDHEALQKQYFDLRAQVKKPGPNATAAEQEAYKQSDAQLKALRKQLGQQAAEYLRIKPLAEQERARRAPKAEEAAPETPVPPPGQMEIPGFERGDFTEPEAAPPPEAVDYNQQARVLRARLEELQTQARDTKNLDEKIALGERYSQTEKAASEAEKKAKEAIRPTQQIGMLKRKMAIAEEEGDVAAQVDLAQKLKALGVDDITAEAQTEMALTPFKGKSEGTNAFNQRVVGPEIAAGREAAAGERAATEARLQTEQASLRGMAAKTGEQQPIREARQERQTQLEIEEMERGALDTTKTEQRGLFETEPALESRVYTGGGEQLQKSRAELVADLRIARYAGDRAAVTNTIDAIRDLDERTAAPAETASTLGKTRELAEPVAGTKLPIEVARQRAAADARSTAYADMVSIVSKYNQGKAKVEELEQARQNVVNNLIADIETTRGTPVEDDERRDIIRQASVLLRDLVMRFGDTRNLSQKGTAQRPFFVPAQTATGEFVKGPASEIGLPGYPTVESRAPGQQTFSNPYAAAQTIKEGLNEIRNKAVGNKEAATVERTYTPEQVSPEMLRKQLDTAFAKDPKVYTPEQRVLLEQIADNLAVINMQPDNIDLVSNWVYRLGPAKSTIKTGKGRAYTYAAVPDALTNDVKNMLAGFERGKRSETETVTREFAFGKGEKTATAVQEEMFSNKELQGFKFATAAEFDKYLASDALQQMRSAIGLGRPTIQRLLQRVAPFQKQADALRLQVTDMTRQYEELEQRKRNQLDELATMSAQEQEREQRDIKAAEQILNESKQRLQAVVNRLDAELTQFQIDYIQAEQAFSFSVKTSEDITKAIAANITGFEKNETAAMEKVLAAKAALNEYLTRKLVTDKFPGGEGKIGEMPWEDALRIFTRLDDAVALQNAVVDATRQWRSQFAVNQSTSRIVSFLDKDLLLQVQLQSEAARMDGLAKDLLNAGTALTVAKGTQERSTKNKKALREAGKDVDEAQALLDETKAKVQERTELVGNMERDLGADRVTYTHRFTDESSTVQVLRAANELETSLAQQLAPMAERLQKLDKTASRVLDAFLRNRDRARRVREETPAERLARDQQQRRLETAQFERVGNMPGERVSFEGRRELINLLDVAPENLDALNQIVTDADDALAVLAAQATSAQATVERLNAQIAKEEIAVAKGSRTFKAKLDKQTRTVELGGMRDERDNAVKRLEGIRNDQALITKAKEDATKSIPKIEARLAEVENLFSNEPEIAAAVTKTVDARIAKLEKNITKVTATSQEKGITTALRASRLNDLRKYKRELAAQKAKRSAKRGIVRTSVEDLKIPSTQPIEPETRLRNRKVGPLVRPNVTAGNIRTGDADTKKERTLSTRSKIVQGGTTREIKIPQSQRAAMEITAAEIDAYRDRVEDALITATEANDTEKIARYTNALERLNKAYAVQEKKLQAARGMKETDVVDFSPYAEGVVLQTQTGAPEVALTRNAIDALENNDLSSALEDLAKVSNNDVIRAASGIMKRLLENTQVQIISNLKDQNGNPVYGAASTDGKVVWFDREFGFNEETLAHESTHAATERVIQTPEDQLTSDQLLAKRELEKLFAAAKASPDITSENAKSSLSEYVAEAFSNGVLQNQLRAKAWTLGDMWKAFKKTILNMLGVKTPTNMLDATLAAAETLFSKPARYTAADATLAKPSNFRKVAYANPGLARAGEIGDTFIAKDRSTLDRVRAASGGFLGMETMLVDRFAGFERLSKTMEALKGSQMMYYLRMYDQRMNFVSQAVSNGALQIVEKTRSDGRKEFLVESKSGPSIAGVVNILKDSPAGSADAANRLFTLYLAANRAKNKGIETLHFGTALTQADLNEAMTAIRATPGLEENFKLAQKEYNDYNRGLVEFLVQTGAIGKDVANRLMAENDYIPFYRERGGLAELVIGNEPPIRIGSIAEQPYLKELVGGDKPILDFMTSSVQNTNLLADMGLRNLATKNAVFELVNMDLAKIGAGRGTAGPDVVRFKVDGEDRFALIDTDKAGIPADILVKGMEGIPTQLPAAFRLLGMPATLLRKAVTLSPLYAAKQLFRDSLAAPLLAGADFVPVLGALKEVGASSTKKLLEQRGITGGQIFTGTQADLTKILKDLAENKPVSWGSLIAKAEAINMEADASTRRAQYNSYIRQGLSEMEATLMSLESMNFNKRGASPSIHALNSLIPFFNAQIQSLNVLYKAVTGKLPFNERLKIQEKLLTRGLMIAAGTLAYAAAMQDDEAYKNATPEQKYGNWFIRIPGVDEPIRLPIPFEVGYIFKALPEALYNTMVDKHGGEEAVKAFRTILLSTIPGGSSYGIPQALKPAIEAGLGKSFYTGRDILSRREQTLLPEQQFRENTSELAKAFGSLGISPIKVGALINGYTGTMGLAFAQAVGTLMPTRTAPEQAYKRLSEMPVVGGAFQPNDAGGIINNVYEHMLEFKKVKVTVDDMIKRGDTAGARELISTRSNEFATSQMADHFVTTMGKLTQYEQAIRASDNTPEKKREQLDKIRQAKIRFSEMTRQATDRTTPQ